MSDGAAHPSISVILVSDFAAGGPEGMKDIRKALQALAHQDLEEPFEVVVAESERFRDGFPEDLREIVPSVRVLFFPDFSSYALKNEAVRAARAEFTAILDADCIPQQDWLRRLVAELRAHPEAAAVSGRTVYPGRSLSVRVCSLLARSYVDLGQSGLTRFIAINNCGFRREAYLEHPLPIDLGTFSSRIQSEALWRAGWQLRFRSDIRVQHAFEGWVQEADLRRNAGHGTIATRLRDATLPWAGMARLGRGSIAPILAGKVINSWRDCVRCGRDYGLSWYELPAAMALSIPIHLLEIPGMLDAYRGVGIRKSSFR